MAAQENRLNVLNQLLQYRQAKLYGALDKNGDQIRCDSYSHEWKDSAIKLLKTLADKTKVGAKKSQLQQWAITFEGKHPHEIYQFLQTELQKPNTILKEHFSPIYSPAQLFTANSYTEIEKLVEKGKRYCTSEYTIAPIRTGRKI